MSLRTCRALPVLFLLSAGLTGLVPGTGPARAAGGHSGGHGLGFGEPAQASQASRTIEVTMLDNFYEPEKITIKAGETVRFVVRNDGELVHEFNVGTAEMHAEHQQEMAMMVDHGVLEADRINRDRMKMDMGGGRTMEHNDPNSVLLEPGETGEVVLKFTKPTELEFACNVPGHYEAGMVGPIKVNK